MIEDIQAREKAATPGPLELCIDGTYIWRTEAPAQLIARFENKVDARFYYHAREDIPYLLAQLRDREEKLEAVEGLAANLVQRLKEAKERKVLLNSMTQEQKAAIFDIKAIVSDGVRHYEAHLDHILKGGD